MAFTLKNNIWIDLSLGEILSDNYHQKHPIEHIQKHYPENLIETKKSNGIKMSLI